MGRRAAMHLWVTGDITEGDVKIGETWQWSIADFDTGEVLDSDGVDYSSHGEAFAVASRSPQWLAAVDPDPR